MIAILLQMANGSIKGQKQSAPKENWRKWVSSTQVLSPWSCFWPQLLCLLSVGKRSDGHAHGGAIVMGCALKCKPEWTFLSMFVLSTLWEYIEKCNVDPSFLCSCCMLRTLWLLEFTQTIQDVTVLWTLVVILNSPKTLPHPLPHNITCLDSEKVVVDFIKSHSVYHIPRTSSKLSPKIWFLNLNFLHFFFL